MKRAIAGLLFTAAAAFSAQTVHAQQAYSNGLTLDLARKCIAAAEAEAKKILEDALKRLRGDD